MTDSRQHEEQHENVWLLLPWYANGTLDATERRLVEGHLAGCPACRDEAARCSTVAAALREGEETAPSPHPIQLARLMERIQALDARDALAGHDGHGGNIASAAHAASGAHDVHDENTVGAASDDDEIDDLSGGMRHELGRSYGHGEPGEIVGKRQAGGAARAGAAGAREASLLGTTPRRVRIALVGQLAAMLLLAAALAFRPAGQSAPAAPPAALYHVLAAPAATADGAEAAARPRIRLVFVETATEKQIREVLLRTRGRLVDGPSPLGAYTLEVPAPASPSGAGMGPAAGAGWTDRAPVAAGDAAHAAAAAAAPPAPRLAPAEAAPDSLGIVLAYLRSQAIVRFAEPVEGAAAREAR